MKQMIFINTFVQPDRFCFVHLISVEQQNWSRGWALSNLQTYPAYLASAASFRLLISLIFQGGIRKPHRSGMYYQAGFTARLALAMAIPWPQGSLQPCSECHQQTVSPLRTYTEQPKKEERDYEWVMGTRNLRFQRESSNLPETRLLPRPQLQGSLSSAFFHRAYMETERDAQPWGTATTDQLDCGATEPTVPD